MISRMLFLISTLLTIMSIKSIADEPDSLAQLYVDSYAIVDISHYDDDGVADTLLAIASRSEYMKPYKILWGDNTHGVSKKVTEFHYPEVSVMDLSTAPIDRNEDNIQDIMFFIHGKYLNAENRETEIRRTITIYGHSSLKNTSDIFIVDLVETSESPFYYTVMDDCDGIGRSNIDYSTNITQYELEQTHINIPPLYKEKLQNELSNVKLNLSPNPITDQFNISCDETMIMSFDIYNSVCELQKR